MQFITVFLGGFLSFFSPCILPVIPLYIGYLSGNDLSNRKKIIINTIFFVLGISFAFVLLALGFSKLGQMFHSHKNIFTNVSGVITIILGLFQLGLFKSKILGKEKRLDLNLPNMNFIIAFIFGFTFSFAWTPCIGPTLSGVLFAISNTQEKSVGMLLMLSYTLGFVIPFLLTGIFSSYILKIFRKYIFIVKYTPKIMGVLLIILGTLILTNNLNILLVL